MSVNSYRWVVGWPDERGRRRVRGRFDGVLVGFIRSAENRYFAEHANGMPIEGTFRTRDEALEALVES